MVGFDHIEVVFYGQEKILRKVSTNVLIGFVQDPCPAKFCNGIAKQLLLLSPLAGTHAGLDPEDYDAGRGPRRDIGVWRSLLPPQASDTSIGWS